MSKHTTLEQLKLAQERTKAEFDKLSNRVEELEVTGGQTNVLEGVQVNGVALEIANKLVDILIATGTADGTISVNKVDVAVAGLKALAYKEEITEAELGEALKAVINAKLDASDLSDLEDAIETLVGEDDEKSVREISAEEVAKIVAGADQSYDTLKEIADWIMSDQTGAAKMSNDIVALTTKLTLGTKEGGTEYATVKEYVEAVIAALATTETMTTELAKKVDKRDGYDLSKNDFTDELKAKLEGIETATDGEVTSMLDDVWGSDD